MASRPQATPCRNPRILRLRLHLHARFNQALDQLVGLGGFGWHGDHYADGTAFGHRSQEMVGPLGNGLFAAYAYGSRGLLWAAGRLDR